MKSKLSAQIHDPHRAIFRQTLDHLEQAMARRFDPLVGTKAPVTMDARLEMAGIK